MASSAAISPTAHYTGHVWARNGLSHPLLDTREGRVLFEARQPAMRISSLVGGPSLEAYLLARHEAIDERLEHAIEHEGVTEVVEIAAGLSPRGWRFASRHVSRS
jgi:O-methyltransferase involved in polyketide biosynthesis